MHSADESPATPEGKDLSEALIRRRFTVRGLVQGVGFRPFVHRLAQRHGIHGWVQNGPGGVEIEAEGPPPAVAAFHADITRRAPALAVVTAIEETALAVNGGSGFRVIASATEGAPTTLPPPDIATCERCLEELRDPADRRFRYPFLNCTDCGPRYTILESIPYDRERTGMRGFPLCADCRFEYGEIADRRYHAEPVACPACGPKVWLTGADGSALPEDDPIAAAARRLAGGEIVAVKGLGGFHLACAADNPRAVARLRTRKGRPAKPLAIMARDLEVIRSFARVSEREEELLLHWRRPIVLLEARVPGEGSADRIGAAEGDVAAIRIDPAVGGSARKIGTMLPYTPLHHLLLAGPSPALVMTSGNRTDEPIARENDEATTRLAGIADAFLLHDRPILNRADDSVVRVAGHGTILMRRSRGYVPQPVPLPVPRTVPLPVPQPVPQQSLSRALLTRTVLLPHLPHESTPCVIAVGGDLKGACCLIVRGEAFPGPHVGDLEHPTAAAFLLESMETLIRLLGARPEVVVHDLHPDYVGTALAAEFAARHGLRRLAVQHHHAHGLACLAENLWTEPVIVVALDGTGYGTDGTIWGGEVLVVDGTSCSRAASLRPRPLPGGDRAALEPWRMALSVLRETDGDGAASPAPGDSRPESPPSSAPAHPDLSVLPFLDGLDPQVVSGVDALLRSPDCPRTSSAGRIFDAAAAILGLRSVASFDGQAAMELEELAAGSSDRESYPFVIEPAPVQGAPIHVDLAPALRALLDQAEVPRADRARRFHNTFIKAMADTCALVRDRTSLSTVAVGGGVFQNAIILDGLTAGLEARGFRVLVPRQVPPNDGGLSLGQAWYGVLAGNQG